MANTAEKLEAEIKIKSDPDEFFRSFGGNPNLCSEKVHGIDVHEGDWKSDGSVKLWTYAVDGKVETVKERLTRSSLLKRLKDTLRNSTRTTRLSYRLFESIAKWSIEYENINENDPAPT